MKNPKNAPRIAGSPCGAAAALALALVTGSASAAVTASIAPESSFPGSPDFATYDPTSPGTDAERTLTQTAGLNRVISQTFQLSTTVDIGQISLLYERGKSATLVQVWVFEVSNTAATNIQADFDNAVSNGFLLDAQFAMPTTPDEDKGLNGGVDRTLILSLTDGDVMTLAANTGSAGYAIAFQAVDADGGTTVLENAFTWRFREANPYSGGRLFYDGLNGAQGSGTRDAALALVAVPEPASAGLACIGALALLGVLRRRA